MTQPLLSLLVVLSVLVTIHMISDFLFQPRWMATGKSESKLTLIAHCSIILTCTVPVYIYVFDISKGLCLAFINALSHALIDWNLWNGYKLIVYRRIRKQAWEFLVRIPIDAEKTCDNVTKTKLKEFKEKKLYAEDHWFYAFIGIDQTLHMLMYLFTFYLGFKL